MKKIFKPNNDKTQSIVFKSENEIFINNTNNDIVARVAYYKGIVKHLQAYKALENENHRNMLFLLRGGYFIEIEPALYASCNKIHANLEELGDVYYTTDIKGFEDGITMPLYKLPLDILSKLLDDLVNDGVQMLRKI